MESAVTQIEEAIGQIRDAVERVLAATDGAQPRDAAAGDAVLGMVQAVGTAAQSAHGLMLQLLAAADRLKAARGGVGPWLATHLDCSHSRARQLALEGRTIGALPQLAQGLVSGTFGPDTTRALARTAKAVKGTSMDLGQEIAATVQAARSQGVAAANLRVRVLEHTVDPGSTQDEQARQRARSFLRFSDVGDGLTRIDGVLDTVRATTLRQAIDAAVGCWLRAGQLDATKPLPADVALTEQYGAQALTRLAEVFLQAPAARRDAAFSTPILFHAPLPGAATDTATMWNSTGRRDREVPQGCAVSAYGSFVALTALPPVHDCAAHLLLNDVDGRSVVLDGEVIDQDPGARSASPAQRVALAFRDRHCTFPGCDRPAAWSLDAHHVTAYAEGGQTILGNLALVCSQHHTAIHHPDTR
jgi:hypothetical protein